MTGHDKQEKGGNHICTVEHLKFMDSFLRKTIHNPKKLFGPYIKEGMAILDLGCGGGFATIPLAIMAGKTGKVIAADLQDEMLKITGQRAAKAGLSGRIRMHKCSLDKIGYTGTVDFALAFFMIHESPYVPVLIKEIYSILKEGGIFFISEPSFYVSKSLFENMIKDAENAGFIVYDYPKVALARSVVLKK